MARVISKKQQKMYDALIFVDAIISGGSIYCLRAPKRLVREYEKADKHELDGEKLTAMEKTRLYGYLNPRYRIATYPRKRIR